MTDKEIVKALEECANNGYNNDDGSCSFCPLYHVDCPPEECMTNLMFNILPLINRQKAEIERLQRELNNASHYLSEIAEDWEDWDD